jgi:hypothetical protein
MNSNELETTVPIKACSSCSAGLLDRDKFCRWCGARQPACSATGPALESTSPIDDSRDYRTTALASHDVYHPISGALVNAVIHGASSHARSGLTSRLILALISIPIWMIIVLLSPLDAYASAKILAERV